MRRLCPRGLPYVALGCAILAAQTLKADTILINDQAGLVTVSVTDPVREQASTAPGFADVEIHNPPGATVILNGGLLEWKILEPGQDPSGFNYPISDVMTADEFDLPSGDTILSLDFFSGNGFSAECSSEACIVESGDIQTFWSLEWSDGTIDTFEFKSTEPAPEPSTLLLLCTGMLGVGAIGRRKYFSRVFSNADTRGVSVEASK